MTLFLSLRKPYRLFSFSVICSYPKVTQQTFRMASNKVVEQIQSDLKELFHTGVAAVVPHKLINENVHIHYGKYFFKKDFLWDEIENVYLVGFGKAAMSMALALEQISNKNIKRGIVSVPPGSIEKHSKNKPLNSRLDFYEGGENNQPNECSLQTTEEIFNLLRPLTKNDCVIVTISGGGSALLVKPKIPITLEEKKQLCRNLQNAGADITELNTVRIALSDVKGGDLIRVAHPARVVSLILSDIVGDPIDLIAGGPTVLRKDLDSAINVLKKYYLFDCLSSKLRNVLIRTEEEDELKHNDEDDYNVNNYVIGNNMTAILAAKNKALEKCMHPVILSNTINGDVRSVSQAYADLVSHICDAIYRNTEEGEFVEEVQGIEGLPLSKCKAVEIFQSLKHVKNEGIVLIAGGEPTVKVQGKGKGGRNQELALLFSLDWSNKIKSNSLRKNYEVVILSAGTDGQDGPTDAAGAFGYPQIGSIMLNLRLKALEAKKLVDNNMLSSLDYDAVEQFKDFQNAVLNEKKNYIDKHFLKKILDQINLMEPNNVLKNNDTYSFYSRFNKGQDLLKCGITGTNVMDLHFIVIKKTDCCCGININAKKSNIFLDHDLYVNGVVNKEVENNTPCKCTHK